MTTQLFDTTSRIAAKLARCAEIARNQLRLSVRQGIARSQGFSYPGMTDLDYAILARYSWGHNVLADTHGRKLLSRRYLDNLNA